MPIAILSMINFTGYKNDMPINLCEMCCSWFLIMWCSGFLIFTQILQNAYLVEVISVNMFSLIINALLLWEYRACGSININVTHSLA